MAWTKRGKERELARELIAQTKLLCEDVKEHNRLYREVRITEKEALEALAKKVGGGG